MERISLPLCYAPQGLSLSSQLVFSPRVRHATTVRQDRLHYQPPPCTWTLPLSNPQKSVFLVTQESGFLCGKLSPSNISTIPFLLGKMWLSFIYTQAHLTYQMGLNTSVVNAEGFRGSSSSVSTRDTTVEHINEYLFNKHITVTTGTFLRLLHIH